MSAFQELCEGIASQLDGIYNRNTEGADGAPVGFDDIAWIDLRDDRAGLRVVIRRGHMSEASRLRASMSLTREGRKGQEYRLAPHFYDLETAAAMSRGARVIAAQIEAKIIQPALPMLAEWGIFVQKKADEDARLACVIADWRDAIPKARIELKPGEGEAEIFLSCPGGYLQGRINATGGLYITRASRVPEKIAMDLVRAIVAFEEPEE